jgi:hypothetical protein
MAMSTLERELIDKFHQLDRDAQQRVRLLIEQETDATPHTAGFDFAAWQREVEAIRADIRVAHGGIFPQIDVVTMLREIRDGEDE